MIIGKKYKENEIGLWVVFSVIFLSSLIGILAFIYIEGPLWLKIMLISILTVLFLFNFYIPYLIFKQRKQKDEVLLYDDFNEAFIINYHNKTIKIYKNKIIRITNHNIGVDDKALFIINRLNYGKIKFYLKDGSSYKTPCMDNIYDVYFKADDIIYGEVSVDRYEETRPVDKLIEFENKVDNWGSKKEYPAILSLLVAILLPFLGLIFVSNQSKYKEMKYGKNNGIMIASLIISAIWVVLIIIAVNVLL